MTPQSHHARAYAGAPIDDTITIIRARGRRLAKLIKADGAIEGYDLVKTVDLRSHAIADLSALARTLRKLSPRPDLAVVRGEPIDPVRCQAVRRLVHADQETGDAATLQEKARRWVALDLDGLQMPPGLHAADLAGCHAAAGSALPVAFSGAACIVQASASHGLKPGLRMRLWYWLSRPTSGAELKRWFKDYSADASIFRPAQVIYTAAPVFEDGRTDHLPARILEIGGREAVAVPSEDKLAPPATRAPKPSAASPPHAGDRYAFAALRNAAVRVATTPEGNRHVAILREAVSLRRFADSGHLTQSDIRAVLINAASQAGKDEDEAEKVVAWVFAHATGAAMQGGAR